MIELIYFISMCQILVYVYFVVIMLLLDQWERELLLFLCEFVYLFVCVNVAWCCELLIYSNFNLCDYNNQCFRREIRLTILQILSAGPNFMSIYFIIISELRSNRAFPSISYCQNWMERKITLVFSRLGENCWRQK